MGNLSPAQIKRPELLQDAAGGHGAGTYLVETETLGDLSLPLFEPFYRFNSISGRSKLEGPRAAVTRHGV